jgi:hypothetical protein
VVLSGSDPEKDIIPNISPKSPKDKEKKLIIGI